MLESQSLLVELSKSVDSKLTINEHLSVLPTAFLPNELRTQKCKSLGFHSERASSKTPTKLTVDGCSVHSRAFECLNGTHTAVGPSYVIYSQKDFI